MAQTRVFITLLVHLIYAIPYVRGERRLEHWESTNNAGPFASSRTDEDLFCAMLWLSPSSVMDAMAEIRRSHTAQAAQVSAHRLRKQWSETVQLLENFVARLF
ncbi:hypothetical protein CYMTET_32665 [Cymbomonas tetramitiformis]|uniref:Secreted protein n=1 Tax=Cymbomonas tetramitiformis TaxID=36881 RepID=A0AAE0KRM8_9CHLO|nr:hypothetical protein CYMTET_32665 [Cymbomonas tetramitiformis]